MVYILFFAALVASFFALFGIWMVVWSLSIGSRAQLSPSFAEDS